MSSVSGQQEDRPFGQLPIAGVFVRQFLRRSGITPAQTPALLTLVGIEPGRLDDPDLRVSERQFARFLLALSRRGRDEFWGLASRPVPLGTFRMFCRLIVNCHTLGQALTIGGRFYRLVVDDFVIKVRSENGISTVWLKVGPQKMEAARHAEMQATAAFVLYQLMCWLVDRRLPLTAVHFAFDRGPNSAEPLRAYETLEVRFGQPYTGLQLREHLLALPILADESRLSRFLSDSPRGMAVRYHDATRVDDKVRAILRRSVGLQVDLEDVASQLHMTSVTLRRRLAEEGGRSFSGLRDGIRRLAALEMVRQGQKLEIVALRLGFAEYSTFHRAFRRWTGLAPTEYRQRCGRMARKPTSELSIQKS